MADGIYKPDALEERLRRTEHALLRAIPRGALRAIRSTQQIAPDHSGQIRTKQLSVRLLDLLSPEQDNSGCTGGHCLLCHDRVGGGRGILVHLGLEDGPGPRCAVFPAIIDIMRDCAAKRREDRLERMRWRKMHRR